jgi:hypothetical protein
MCHGYAVADEQGYSIESRCRAVPLPEHREHRALALGKRPEYFGRDWKDFMWPDLLPPIIKKMPAKVNSSGTFDFEIISTAEGGLTDFADQGFRNLGLQTQSNWNQILAASKILVSRRAGCVLR